MVEKFYSFDNNVSSFTEMRNICYNLLHKLCSVKSEWCVVVVKHTTDNGVLISEDVNMFKSYASNEAAKFINKYEYSSNTAVDVFSVTEDGFILMLCKYYDGVCYSRLAGCELNSWIDNEHLARHLFDVKATVYVED